MRHLILLSALLLSQPGSVLAQDEAPTYRNLVFILIDDLGAIDLACTGSTYYKTPNIDSLAKRGMVFNQAYAASGVCSPTRASILTGHYPQRCRITTYIPGLSYPHAKLTTPPSANQLPDNAPGYAEFLKKAGIRSFRVGKWHLGRNKPEEFGFDMSYDNGKRNRMDDPWSVSEFTDKVCAFIEESGSDRFLAVLSHHTVHVPLHEKPEDVARWSMAETGDNGQANPTMGAMIESMDRSVGRVLDTLKQCGREKDTAIVFFSDNGGLPLWQDQDGKVVVATSNLPLRGGKSTLYEGGIRVPLIVAAPGLTDSGAVCATPVHSNDLAPTLLSLMGAPSQPKSHLDGVDLTPLLRNQRIPDRNLFWYYPHYQTLPPHAAVRSGPWKMITFYETGKKELYHLSNDIGEKNDLSKESPEVTTALTKMLEQHLRHLKVPLPTLNSDFNEAKALQSVKSKKIQDIPMPVMTRDPVLYQPLQSVPEAQEGGLAQQAIEPQRWTSREGKIITATFVRIEGEKVVLELADGRQVPYPLEKLDAASEKQARELVAAMVPGVASGSNGQEGGIAQKASGPQRWANREGKIITATFVRIEGENVVIKLANGRQVPYPLEKLNAASEEQAHKLAAAMVAEGKPPSVPEVETPPPAGEVSTIAIPPSGPRDPSLPLVGAIRWDAWTGGWVTEEMQKTLGPEKYHHRLPWFAEVKGDGTVKIDGGKQSIMDTEIAMATSAGLDYWAFLLYPENDVMSASLGKYLKSPRREDIGFCTILHNALRVSKAQWPGEKARFIKLLREPGYITVLDGRPLVYEFAARDGEEGQQRFEELCEAVREAGMNPYYVCMGGNPVRGAKSWKKQSIKGFDAVSLYARTSSKLSEFSVLAEENEETMWEPAAKAQVPYIPLVTTGWNKEPRKDAGGVSWEAGHSYLTQEVFIPPATADEIASHLKRALTFVKDNPKTCQANALIMYAWNEHDEGGWLVPTWTPQGSPNMARLDAIRAVLRPGGSVKSD